MISFIADWNQEDKTLVDILSRNAELEQQVKNLKKELALVTAELANEVINRIIAEAK